MPSIADGQIAEETDWFRVVCREKLAETADQSLKKGARVYVEGRLQQRKYTGNDGVERTAVEIVATDLLMLSARESEPVAVRQPFPTDDEDDFDDLPF